MCIDLSGRGGAIRRPSAHATRNTHAPTRAERGGIVDTTGPPSPPAYRWRGMESDDFSASRGQGWSHIKKAVAVPTMTVYSFDS